jgi:iron(III) transport system substrate-binding protein
MKAKKWILLNIIIITLVTACQAKLPKLPKLPASVPGSSTLSGSTDTVIQDRGQIIPLIDPATEEPLPDEEIAFYKDDPNTLIIYTALKKQHIDHFMPLFLQEHPEVKIVWLSQSTGDLTRRLTEESSIPVADVVWGVSASALLQADAGGVIEGYRPKGLDRVTKSMRDNLDPPHWIGMHAFIAALCVNPEKLEELNLPTPRSWQDLLDPIYRNPKTGEGYLVMPNPRISSTGYLIISGWIQLFGEEEAWVYMDTLDQNMAEYIPSGRTPCNLAGQGQYPIAISFAAAASDQIRDYGRSLVVVLPEEGVGWDVEGLAKVRKPTTKRITENFIDWALSDTTMYEDAGFFPIISVDLTNPRPVPIGYPAYAKSHLIEQDFDWRTANYERITLEWLKRYDRAE